MPTRATTDNFLPYLRGKSTYRSRPTVYLPRPDHRGTIPKLPVSDFFTPNAKSKPKRARKPLIYSLATGVFVLGITTGLASFVMLRQKTQQVKYPQATLAENSYIPPKHVPASIGKPIRLNIPKINVNANVEHVGLTPQGDMDAPKAPANVAWYQQGPRPGEKGSSVIDGHFGYKDGLPAIFDNLRTLQKGDKISVVDEKGVSVTFVVSGTRTFGPNEDASSVFRSNDEKAHLNLITCEGAWNKTQKSYASRLVVFADKEID